MGAMTRGHRILFQIGCFFALWIGFWNFVMLGQGHNPLPFEAPPLHMRFAASLYLGGAVMMFLSARAMTLAQVRITTVIATLFTGTLLIASIANFSVFDFSYPGKIYLMRSAWWWWGLYILCPIIGLRLLAKTYPVAHTGQNDPLPVVLRGLTFVAGLAGVAFAVFLFAWPNDAGLLWPWKITPLLAQIYAGPILTFSIGAILLAVSRDRSDGMIAAAGISTFALFALLASLLHIGIFAGFSAGTLAWFVTLVFIAGLFGAVARVSRQPKEALS